MNRWLSSGLFLSLALPAMAQPQSPGPILIGEIFCLGLTGGDMDAARAALTDGLNRAIDSALERNDAIQAATPDEKPPLGDGIPWSGYPDYSPICMATLAGDTPDAAEVTITHRFPEYRDADYEDTLRLVPVEGRYGENLWRIDNIAYGPGGDLRGTLESAFE